jgi:NAD(P)H-dependent FMN reductase
MDQELQGEFPGSVRTLNALFKEVDGLLISLPEYNSGITPVFKNMMDWISRLEKPTLKNKAICLLSTSPGSRGAKTNLAHVSDILIDRWGGVLTATFSLAYFDRHLVNGELELVGQEKESLMHALAKFNDSIRGMGEL